MSKLGRAAQAMTVRRLHALWPHLNGMDVLGYGYAIPYLKTYENGAHRIINAMSHSQGAARHCPKRSGTRRGNTSLLVCEHELPFPPSVFDRVVIAHGLEETPNFSVLLEEIWRVLKPEGRVVIIVANRSGLWARSDKTPFGAGRPFSRKQLSNALKNAKFVPLVRAGTLYCPPINSICEGRTAQVLESFGETVWPGFSGLVLVEAVKRLYAGRGVGDKRRAKQQTFTGSGVLGTPQSGKIISNSNE
ncbi:MAG: methyltransferase domain-containing protein [Robiginitomaculum sp.]